MSTVAQPITWQQMAIMFGAVGSISSFIAVLLPFLLRRKTDDALVAVISNQEKLMEKMDGKVDKILVNQLLDHKKDGGFQLGTKNVIDDTNKSMGTIYNTVHNLEERVKDNGTESKDAETRLHTHISGSKKEIIDKLDKIKEGT